MRNIHFLLSVLLAVVVTAAKLNKALMLQAMEDASDTMAQHGEAYTLIVQGGAVNVLLGNREETGDLDFVGKNFNPEDMVEYNDRLEKLKKGLNWAVTQSKQRGRPIPPNWVDTSVFGFFWKKPDRFNKFVAEAEAQAVVLSTAGIDEEDGAGIRFIAAPWSWQFTSKLHDVRKDYDLDDAAFYLLQWLQKNGSESIQYDVLKGWFAAWEWEVPTDLARLCAEVNKRAKRDIIVGTFE